MAFIDEALVVIAAVVDAVVVVVGAAAAAVIVAIACRLGDLAFCGMKLNAPRKSSVGSSTTAGILWLIRAVAPLTPGSRLRKSSAGALLRLIIVADPVVAVVAMVAAVVPVVAVAV